MKLKGFLSLYILMTILFAATIFADEIELKKVDDSQIYLAGFRLNSSKTLPIHVLGAGGEKELKRVSSPHHGDTFNLFTYAWILDANSREMVWRMRLKDSEKDWWNKWNVEYEGEIDLPEGEYELYFSMVKPTVFALEDEYMSLEKMWKKMFGAGSWWEDHSEEWFCRLKNVDVAIDRREVEEYHEDLKNQAVINLTDLGDRAYEGRGFSLQESMEVEIYGIGEGFEGEMYDYGWILDANTRRRVWEMFEPRSDYAGGGIKNRLFQTSIKLDAGDYLVYFKTDDNHSDEEWNANPPYDPYFWGLTLFAEDPDFDPSMITKFDVEDESMDAIVDLTRMGDNEYEKQAFLVKTTGEYRVYALGEGQDGHMYDYAWITDARTGRMVWKMRYRDTKHGGGAHKNREVEKYITLEPGEYIAHFQTDGSHSYEDWNMRRPRDPELWGLSIYPVGAASETELLRDSEINKDYILAELVRIGDDEYVRKQFELDKPTRVRVYCIGEGEWDEMYDYGWIKMTETGRIVWKMRYDRTEHAGGAKKNRKVDMVLSLDPGNYIVYYKTDDSHSFLDWNSPPPYDEEKWGITVYRLDH